MKVKEFARKSSAAGDRIPVVIYRGDGRIATSVSLYILGESKGNDFPGAQKILDSTINCFNIKKDEITIYVK